MTKEGGTVMERQMETDRLKRESAKLKRNIKDAKEKEKEYAQTAKEQDNAAKEVERLNRQYEGQKRRRDATEANLNRTKPLTSWKKMQKSSNAKSKQTDKSCMTKTPPRKKGWQQGIGFQKTQMS